MLKHELYKILIAKRTWIVLVLAFVIFAVISNITVNSSRDLRVNNRLYISYINELRGELDEDKINYILEEKQFIEDVLGKDDPDTLFFKGEITREEYLERDRERKEAKAKERTFNVIYERYLLFMEYETLLSQEEGVESQRPWFVYDLDWETLLIRFPVNYTFLLAMLIIMITMFNMERTTKAYKIVYSSMHGKKRIIDDKIKCAAIICLSALFIMIVIKSVIVFSRFDLTDYDAPLRSLEQFLYSPYDFTLMQYHILATIYESLWLIILSILILLLSANIKTPVIVFFTGVFIVLIPNFFRNIIPDMLFLLFSSGHLNFNLLYEILMNTDNNSLHILYLVLPAFIYVAVNIFLYIGAKKRFED